MRNNSNNSNNSNSSNNRRVTLLGALAITALLAFAPVAAHAQIPCSSSGPVTSNLGLNVPAFNTTTWNIPINANFSCLDNYLSGSTPIPGLKLNGYVDLLGISTPSNPAFSYFRLYVNSGTNQLSCLTSSGGNCSPSGSGSVTSVNGTSSITGLNITGGPITNTGTLTLSGTAGEPPNQFLATPSGSTGALTLRAMTALDLPATITSNTTGNAATSTSAGTLTGCTTTVSGSVCVWNGSSWSLFSGNTSGTSVFQENASGIPSWGAGSSTTFQANGSSLASSSTVNFLNSAVFNGLTLTFTNPSAGNVQLGVSGTLGNAGLTNSTIGITGTANQIVSGTSTPALGGSTVLSIANPFTFPGPATLAASTTSAASLTIPSGSAPTSPATGNFWNQSGILKFYDGSNINNLTTIQGSVTNGQCPQFSGTSGLMVGITCGGGGGGSVTAFSSGNLTPLFTTSVATSTTTPALTFTLSNAGNYSVLGNATGSSAAPGYTSNPAVSSVILEGSSSGSATLSVTSTAGTLNLGSSSTLTSAGIFNTPTTGVFSLNADTGLSRGAANTVDVGNGTSGDTSGTIQASVFQGVGSAAGVVFLQQGTAQSLATTSVGLTVPTTVTSYNIVLPSAAGSANQVLQIASVLSNIMTMQWGSLSSGTVNSGTASQLAIYPSTGTAVSGDSTLTDNGSTLAYSGGAMTVTGGSAAGLLSLGGNTSNPSIPSSQIGFIGPTTASFTSYVGQFTTTAPTAGQVMAWGAPSSNISTLSWITPANAALSNLASVAINTALLPGTTNSIALGSSSFEWSNVFATLVTTGTSPAITTPGTGWYLFGTEGTEPASIASGTTGFVMDSTSHCPIEWNNSVNKGCVAALGAAQTFSAVQTISASNGLVLSAMTGTTCLEQVSGVVTSTGSACGSGSNTFPLTVGGTVTSGGIPYFSNTTTETSSGILNTNIVVKGGGAGGAPTNSTITDNGTLVSTTEPFTTSYTGTASQSALYATGAPYTGGSTTTNFPLVYVNDGTGPTTFSATGTEFGINTPSGFTGNFLDFHVNGGASVGSLNYQGNMTIAGALTTGTTSCALGTGYGLCGTEGTAFTNASGDGGLYFDSTAHEIIAKTNGSATGGMINRSQPGAVRSTGLVANVSTATLCAASAGACNVAGTYRVHLALYQGGVACTTNTTGGVSVQLTWTDGNGSAHSAITVPLVTNSSLIALTGTMLFNQTGSGIATVFGSGDLTIDTNGTIIQYATTYASCSVTGTATYALSAVVTRLQ